jgi:tetratricopeptide (TPR) repeat protein
MQDICTHVARVERFEEIIRRSPESMPPDLNQTMYDVELIILGAIATFIDEIDYGLEALSLLGSAGEYDPLVEYVYAFSLLEDLVETDEEWNTAIETERRVIGLADKANSETTDILKLFNAKFMVDVGIKREGFAALNDLVKKHPEDPMYPTALATAYLEVNNKRKAVHYLRQALKLAEQEDMDEQILEIAYSLVNLRAMSEKEFVALVEKHDIEIEDEDDFDEDYDDEFDDVEDAREFEMEVILEHPEYAEWFGPKAHLMPDEASDGINPRLHVIVHSIIEKQLELNEPPAVGQALQRLLDQGISRHEAIHRIAALLSEMIFATIKEERAADLRKYERELNKLGR